MISEEKIFDFLAMRANQTSNDTEAGLKLFIPMYSAILGGSIWLSDKLGRKAPLEYKYLSDALVILLAIVCIYIVLDNLRAWWGYRVWLSEMTKESNFPLQRPRWSSAVIEFVLCAGMVGACFMYTQFNPFLGQ